MVALLEKSILNDELEKSRSGVYADTAENRRLHRVGQKYGSKKEETEEPDEKGSNSKVAEKIDNIIESAKEGKIKLSSEQIETLKNKKKELETGRRKKDGKPVKDSSKPEQKKDESAEPETFTRVKFDDVPNSGKVNLKKYLSGKVKANADKNLGILSKVSTDNLKKMEQGLVNDFNKKFDDLPKSQRAEKLYSIMKVKEELAKRGKEAKNDKL